MADFLAALTPADRDALVALARRRHYAAGATIAREHDDPHGVLVILEGQVAASTVGPDGRDVVVGVAGPGELVGELGAVRGAPRSATLVARTDVAALAVRAPEFRRFLQVTPAAAVAVLDTVIERLTAADAQRRELATLDVVARVARRLLELAERFGTETAGGGVDVVVTHAELAAWVGASRESVTKALHALRALRCVATGRGRVTILDTAALRRRAL